MRTLQSIDAMYLSGNYVVVALNSVSGSKI